MNMPMLINTEATMRSTTTNGRKITKPIWKAVRSSLVTKAATMVTVGNASTESTSPAPLISANAPTSWSRVLASMNSRIGRSPFL